MHAKNKILYRPEIKLMFVTDTSESEAKLMAEMPSYVKIRDEFHMILFASHRSCERRNDGAIQLFDDPSREVLLRCAF
jgi:hypothetical protein